MRSTFARRSASVEGPAVDMPDDHDARLRIDHFGRQARRMRSDTGRPLAIAEDVVDRNIAAATRDIAPALVVDNERRVGEPSVQRFELHLAAPAWQRGDARFKIHAWCRVSSACLKISHLRGSPRQRRAR